MNDQRRMILCAGMQSGGTTLVSWCFLQRGDCDGELDMANDCIRLSFDRTTTPIVWCKMTVGCFRWLDVAELYGDVGWSPEPLLVVRDIRAVLASLMRKPYGYNGKTGDRPPLRTRLRRFLRDWELFRERGWPIIKYEELVAHPWPVLAETCRTMGLEWDEAMLSWPKHLSDIAYAAPEANTTFLNSLREGGLEKSIVQTDRPVDATALAPGDLDWLEDAFSAYNECHRYPLRLPRRPAANGAHQASASPPLALHERMLKAEREAEAGVEVAR